MKNQLFKIVFLCLLLGGIVFLSDGCKKENRDPEWNTDLLLPLAKTTLNIQNLIPDSLLKHNGNGTMSIAYQQTLLDTSLLDAVKVPDTTILQKVSIGDFNIGDATIKKSVSLGQIAEQGGLIGATIIANHGSMLSVQSFSTSTPNTQSIVATTLFDQAMIVSGFLDVTIANNFPIDLTDFVFSITNQSDNSLIAQDTFARLGKNGGVASHSISLAGRRVDSKLFGTILNISSPGSNNIPVLIDTSQFSMATIRMRDIKVSSISGVFTNQIFLDYNYELKLPNSDFQLQYATLESGNIHVKTMSNLPERFNVILSSNEITKNGKPYYMAYRVNKSTTGLYANTDIDINLAGYTLDVRGGKPFGYNNIKFNVKASVDSSGVFSTITTQDTVKILFELQNIKPQWAQGYFGRSTLSYGPTSVNIDVFKRVTYGKFKLDQLKLGFIIENGIGVNAKATIKKLQAKKGATTIDLAGSVLDKPFDLGRALDKPFMPTSSNLNITQNNSNITSLVELMPDKIDYQLDLAVNPGGNVFQFKDFFYKESRLKAMLTVEAPLAIGFDLFTITDTVPFNVGQVDGQKRINEGIIKVLVDNGYPFDAFIKVILLDANKKEIDQLFVTNNWVKSGTIKAATPWDCMPVRSSLNEKVDGARIEKLAKVKQAIISVTLVTQNASVKTIYERWNVGVKLVADFNVRVGGAKKE